MKRLLPLRFLPALLAVATAPALAAPEVFTLDPERSFVHFELLHFGTSTIRGRFGPIAGGVTLDRAAQSGEVGLRVATATVSTGLRVFDARIREADLLATEAHPEAYFVATRFRFEGETLAEVRGEFTLRGVSQPLSLKALRFACRTQGEGAAAVERCGGDFEGEILRGEFGADFGLPFIGNRVRLLVQVEGTRPLLRSSQN
jgi:polyisoprenoid-binding protein YceI